jgi:hypothetical protein
MAKPRPDRLRLERRLQTRIIQADLNGCDMNAALVRQHPDRNLLRHELPDLVGCDERLPTATDRVYPVDRPTSPDGHIR